MAFKSLLTFALLGVVAVKASSVVQIRESLITLPIVAHINATGGVAALIKADRARFEALRAQSALRVRGISPVETRATDPLSVTDTAVTYTCNVGIGSPPTTYSLLVDTGSSNTWVGAGKAYVVTRTSRKTSDAVSVKYGKGSFQGTEYTDTVTVGRAAIRSQSIGVASSWGGFQGVDGILGIGPVDLTTGTLTPDVLKTIPTVTDNLKSQHFISSALVGISFEPSTSSLNGQLDFGGIDHSKFTGYINFVPITSTFAASQYWGITQTVMYGASTPIISSSSAGIVDTGTTLLYLPSDAYSRYMSATHSTLDPNTGLLKITSANFAKLKSLFFTIGGVKYEFTANAQIWPRSLNVAIGGSPASIYLVIADNGANAGSGVDFINGFVWLQRFYSVFDTDNKRIGFATTPFTKARTN